MFASTTEAASVLGRDERTIRRAAEAGIIPASRVGAKWSIPVAWLREQAGLTEPPPRRPSPNIDELADRVAAKVVARLVSLLSQGAAATSDDQTAT